MILLTLKTLAGYMIGVEFLFFYFNKNYPIIDKKPVMF